MKIAKMIVENLKTKDLLNMIYEDTFLNKIVNYLSVFNT